MPRTALTISDVTRSGVTQPAQQNGDNVNGNYLAYNDGKIIIEVQNSSGGALNVTFGIPGTLDGVSTAGKVISVAAGAYVYFGPFPPGIYNQADGTVNVDVTASTMKFRVYHC